MGWVCRICGALFTDEQVEAMVRVTETSHGGYRLVFADQEQKTVHDLRRPRSRTRGSFQKKQTTDIPVVNQ